MNTIRKNGGLCQHDKANISFSSLNLLALALCKYGCNNNRLRRLEKEELVSHHLCNRKALWINRDNTSPFLFNTRLVGGILND